MSSSIVSARRRLRGGIIGSLVVGALAVTIAAPGAVLAGGAAVTYQFTVGECYLSGEGPANKQIRIRLLRPNGTQKAAKTTTTGDSGNFEIECLGTIAAGDRLVAKRLNGTQLRSFTVPRVTITLRRETDKGQGKAPAGRDARILSDDCRMSEPMGKRFCGSASIQKDFVIPASGEWSKNAAGVGYDPSGGDLASLFLFTSQGDRVGAIDRGNVVQVQPGSAVVKGIANPGSTVTVTFKNGSNVRGTGTTTANSKGGAFSLTVRKNGDPVALDRGDQVVANVAPDATFTVRSDLELDLSDALNDHVQGTCYPDRPYEAFIDHGDSQNSTVGTAGAAGEVDVPGMTGDAPIPDGTVVQLFCETPKGDRVRLVQTVGP
jgi:hypothetical protein